MSIGRVRLVPLVGMILLISSQNSMAQSTAAEPRAAPAHGNCAALLAQLPDAGKDGPLTERECALMLRVQKLEQTVNSLQDVQARLVALESKTTNASASSAPVSTSPASQASAAPTVSATGQSGGVAASQLPSADSESSTNVVRNVEPKNGAPGSPAMFGEFNPGQGFTVARGELGQLNLSGYMVARYLNQLPPDQSATDHLGRPILVKPRQDFQFHRVMLFAQGWLFSPKFNYVTFVWTVNDTNQVAVGGALYYIFNKRFVLGGGATALPGTQSMQGSHPYWPSYDRVLADEFFRPFFTQGIFGQGELAPRLEYRWTVGNNLSLLGISGAQLTRELSTGGSLTWLPTTGEFGPRGAFGDFEDHEKLATRFNFAYTRSREDRFSSLVSGASPNTTLRLADSLNVFETGTFANGVTVQNVTYQMWSSAVGMKYHGFWLQGEGYYRLLNDFVANGPLPIKNVRDTGFYVQTSYMVVPKTVEIYGGTSYIFSNYGKPKEFIVGGNWYPARNRNYRLNVHLINVDHSPVSSTFGFYVGQLKGTVLAIGATALY